jgi:hypothetical protein
VVSLDMCSLREFRWIYCLIIKPLLSVNGEKIFGDNNFRIKTADFHAVKWASPSQSFVEGPHPDPGQEAFTLANNSTNENWFNDL